MKIAYIANIRIPTEKAHGLQIVKTCEALASAGEEVVLVVPRRRNVLKADPFSFYQIRSNFKIIKVSCIDIVNWGRAGFWLESISFGLAVLIRTWSWSDVIFFSRDELILFLLAIKKRKLFWEVHDGRSNQLIKGTLSQLKGVVAITSSLKKYYQDKGFPENKIIISSDAVDLNEFSLTISQEEARHRLNLPIDKKLIIYTGHLYRWKGVDILAEASKILPQYQFLFVGGTKIDIEKFRTHYQSANLSILGYYPHSDIPYFLKAADLLVLPNSGQEDISRFYTSPMKLFEYLASGTPIIASSLPSLKEILDETNSKLIKPDDPEALAKAIDEILTDNVLAEKLGKQAALDAQKYSWDNRAKSLINFFNNQ